MYSIKCDDYVIYDNSLPMEEFQLIDPVLNLESNSSGSLTFTMLASNRGYGKIKINESYIVVYDDGEEIWAGRPIKEDVTFENNKKYICEGELGFLNDTRAPAGQYYNMKINHPFDGSKLGYVNMLINSHWNQAISAYVLPGHSTESQYNKRFYLGRCVFTKNMPNDTELQYETTYEALNKMISHTRAYMVLRKEVENGVTKKYIDFLRKVDLQAHLNTQTIRFGENLLEFTKSYSWNIVTAILPYCVIDEEKTVKDEDGNDVTTTESRMYNIKGILGDHTYDINGGNLIIDGENDDFGHTSGSRYVYDISGFKKWGWLATSVKFDISVDDIIEEYNHDNPGSNIDDIWKISQAELERRIGEKLLESAIDWMKNCRTDYMSIEVSGFDLSLLGVDVSKLKFLHYTHIISEPHDFDDWLLLTKMEINMNTPESTKYTFGHTYTKYISYITGMSSAKIGTSYKTTFNTQQGGE